MKSVDSGEELNQAGRAIAKLGGRLLPPVDYEIPGCGVRHRVVRVEKLSPTPKGYPRRWAKIQKAPFNAEFSYQFAQIAIDSQPEV